VDASKIITAVSARDDGHRGIEHVSGARFGDAGRPDWALQAD
jgi:hypothetical protein